MLVREIQPYIRLAHSFSDAEFIKKTACTADNRLFYILEGSCDIAVNHTTHTAQPSSVLLLPRGTSYKLSKTPAKVIGINFDYRFDENTNTRLLHPMFENQIRTPLDIEQHFEDAPALEKPIILHEADSLYPKLHEICEVFEKQKLYADRICAGLLIAVISEILLLQAAPQQNENLVDAVIDFIAENYTRTLNNTAIGNKFGYHPNYINRLFVKQTGLSLHRYILNFRISQAVTQLFYTKLSLSEIAQSCGFPDYAYFSRVFKQQHGISPSEYRKKAPLA